MVPAPDRPQAEPPSVTPPNVADADRAALSLEQLSAALTGMLGGDDPYAPHDSLAADDPQAVSGGTTQEACEVTPRSILEAMLFVGSPDNQPLSGRQVAALMRGVRPAEIDALVCELNADYQRRGCPYQVVEQAGGYRMTLRDDFERLRDKFFGRNRQVRLSQAAVEVLAAVAYHQPVTSEEVSKLRGTVSGAVLSQLVRRQLLRLERSADRPRRWMYWTTDRFLELFGLASLAELPKSSDLEPPAA